MAVVQSDAVCGMSLSFHTTHQTSIAEGERNGILAIKIR